MNLHNVIIGPMFTEKTEEIKEPANQVVRYTVKVRKDANKELIKQAFYKIFNVKVVKVNTIIVPGKIKRFRTGTYKTGSWKKAIVTLARGESVDFSKSAG